MRISPLLLVTCLAAVPALLAPWAGAASPAPDEPLRLSALAFDQPVVLEVRDLTAEEADATLRQAFRRLRELEALLDEAQSRLNQDSGRERVVAVEPPVLALLRRALEYCDWSQGAVGPLGGTLADHWQAVGGNPTPPPVPATLAETAGCRRLALDLEGGRVRIAAGSRVALAGFAAGFAADRTVDALRELGAGNGIVRIGRIERAFGPGPHGPGGWPVLLPVFEGYDRPFDAVRLRDRALAVVWRTDWPAGRPLHVDQRTGEPPEDTWATVAVSGLAIDAQALAVAGLVLGAREGRYRMAVIEPEPSVLWLMGSGQGRPLRSELNWSDLRTP